MTKREKYLAITVGVFLIGILGLSAVNRISGAFEARRETIDRLELEISGKDMVLSRGTRAASKIDKFERSSLPADPALARSLYQGWLLELAQERVAMNKVNVGNLPSRPVGDVYYQHAFSVNCQGDLRQLTDFLYKFHNAGFLHRISRLHIRPVLHSKQLALTFAIDALSLTKAPAVKTLAPPVVHRVAEDDRETYMNSILYRNLFSPGNKAPRLARIGTQRGNPQRSLSFRVTASDPENDGLLYAFAGEVPEGARIDERTGNVTWPPTENGEYQISIIVTDTGMPARSDTADVTIRIEDPPPPREPTPEPPGFDAATQAVVTGLTDAFGQRKIFITVRTEGIVLRLLEGDTIDVGTIKGKIKRIGTNQVEIETSDGTSIIVKLGDSLVRA